MGRRMNAAGWPSGQGRPVGQLPDQARSAGDRDSGAASGRPFLWFLSFGRAKERNPAVGPGTHTQNSSPQALKTISSHFGEINVVRIKMCLRRTYLNAGFRPRATRYFCFGKSTQNHCDDTLPFGCPALLGEKRGRQKGDPSPSADARHPCRAPSGLIAFLLRCSAAYKSQDATF